MIVFAPADRELLYDLIERCAREATAEFPEASQEQVADHATQRVAAELARLAEAKEKWAWRVIDALGEP